MSGLSPEYVRVDFDRSTDRVRFTRKFSAAHRIPGDPGVCHRIHGHNYVAEITITSEDRDDNGFIVPADAIKDVVDRKYDHRLILADSDDLYVGVVSLRVEDWIVRLPVSPSTENLARVIADDVRQLVPNAEQVHVRLRETDTIEAEAFA